MQKKDIILHGLLFFLLTINISPWNKEKDSLKINEPAPLFVLRNLKGEAIFLRDYCGKLRQPWKNKKKHVVILSFFTTYCKPCLKEIPELERLTEIYRNKNLKAFLINLKEDRDLVNQFVNQKGIKLPVLLDRYGVVANKYGVTSVPRIFVINQDGRLVWMTRGYEGNFKEKLTKVLRSQL